MEKVTDGLYRGSRPTVKDIELLVNMGIKTVINLECGMYEKLHDDEYERIKLFDEYGIVEEEIPLSDFSSPNWIQVSKALKIIRNRGPAYVHCLHGKDRTGFVIAAYRMTYENWTYEDAKREMFEHGFHKFPYLIWLPELKKYENKTNGGKYNGKKEK